MLIKQKTAAVDMTWHWLQLIQGDEKQTLDTTDRPKQRGI